MDPENSLSRVERTLWTVWCYITEAVSRFIRPQPADIVNNDPNSDQESAADIKHPHSDSADVDTCSGGVDEEHPVARSSLLSLSRPVVTWEHCNTEISLGSDEVSMQHKNKLRKGSERKEDGEEMREEHHSQTENDNSNDLRAKEDKQEVMDMEKLHTYGGLATPENDACERVDTGPQNLKEVAISEERTEGETSAEKETVSSVTSDDLPAETQAKEENDQMHNKEEPDLEAEDTEGAKEDDKTYSEEEQEAKNTEVRVCIITNLHPEEEDHIHEVKAELQENNAVTLDKHPGKEEMIKETQLKEEDDQMHHEEEQDLEAETTEIKVCITTSPVVHLHMQEIEAEAQKKNEVTLDDHPREDETIQETKEKEEEDKTHHEDEKDLGAEDSEVKVCIITSLSPEEEDRIHEVEAELQKKDAVTLDKHPGKDQIIKETQLKEEDDQMHHEEEQDLEAETTEIKVCITTSPVVHLHMQEIEAEAQKRNEVTLDDHPREDETIQETKEKEEEDEDEKDLGAEDNEVKVCIITSLSPEEEDHTHEVVAELQKKDALTLNEHPREDENIKETQLKEEDDQMQHEEEHDLEVEHTEVAEEDDKTHSKEEQEAENTEVKLCIVTSLSPEEEDRIHEDEAELQKNDAVTLDDHPREDETIKETKEKEKDDQMQHEEEHELEAEDTEVKVCIITSLSPEEEDHMHQGEAEALKKDAVTLDEHPGKDQIIRETQLKEEDDQMHHEEEQDLEAETTEIKVCITTSSVVGLHMQEIEAEAQKRNEVTLDDHPREDETIKETKEKEEDDQMQHEEEQALEAETFDVMLQMASENVKISDEIANQALFGDLPDASVVKPVLVGQYPVMAHRSESDEGETEQNAAIEKENIDEAAANKKIQVSELDKSIRSVAEGSEGENVLTEYGACSKEAAEESITLLQTAELTDKEKEDMRVQAVQTKTQQTGVTTSDISVDERLVDQDQEKELSISRETYTEECFKEIVHSSASVTVKPEGETAQETSEEFKNIPLEISEGQFAMLQELNTPTCEEIQEGVSKYNNELWGVDENTTQRFLEAGDSEEIPATQLPEEVESGERESLQNSGWSTGADYLLLKESMEEKQESKEETETSFDLLGEEHSEILDLAQEAEKTLFEGVFQESGHLLGKEEGNLLAGSMKTEVTEGHVGVGDETERRSEELHDGTKRSSFSKEANATGGDCETKEAVAAAEVVRFVIQESVQAIDLVQSISGPSSLQEDTSESGFVRNSLETEPNSVDDSTVEMQDNAIKRKEGRRGDEDADGIQSTKEMENLWVTETAGELIAEESPLNAESELSQDSEPQEIKNQSPDRACEIRAAQIIETATADESRLKDLPATSSEVKSSSTNGHQDVIDEEILDLWIETAMSEDTDDIKQEPEPGQISDAKADTLNEERGDLTLQKELLAESISGESEVVSVTEMSSSTVEFGFLGQSLSELGSSEPQLLKSTSTDSLQWIHDMVASKTADIPGVAARPQPQSETLNALMEESAEPEKESLTDTGVQSPEGRHLDQESQEKAGEERVERVETESGSQKAYEDVAEAVKKVEAEEERLDSSDELKPTESEQPESDTQGETRPESEKNTVNLASLDGPQPGQLEDITESSLPGLNKAEVTEEPTVKSEDENEVDALVLDFAMQRSRIAVKNPRVRPPKNPRSLLQMPSLEPTPTPSSRLPFKVPGGVPLGGMGIGIKLPGLGAGLPVLKKRPPAVREENTQATVSQEPETKPEEKSEAPQQDETPKKPKWMPPKQPGFGNPLMAELKTKLKKTPKE